MSADCVFDSTFAKNHKKNHIQDSILNSSYGLSSTYNSIKAHKIAGVTDAMIDDLFLLYWGQTFDWP